MALEKSKSGSTGSPSGLRFLFAPGYKIATIMFPLITFFGLLVSYGMNTWIPQMLRSSGYDLGSALTFLLAFNIGSGFGMLVITGLADRPGSRPVISVSFVFGALAVSALTLQPAQALVFGLVLLIGFCASSTTGAYGFVGVFYPAAARGTALGLVVGLGRLGGVCGPILTGMIMSSALGADWAFYAFAFAEWLPQCWCRWFRGRTRPLPTRTCLWRSHGTCVITTVPDAIEPTPKSCKSYVH
ncbi:MFS transporter [Rhodococcus oxybenzonivorans]|uniref:MFS transporter n=1 Tax=Rhodococcus oxybenzonivorans TaxID=1990687 RepID=UPI002953AD21|nr:MFS transporter [Rhodococcus oxybenzonivorans]MDV7352822.1 MFS transporter [Rhodococcus oxybenzonivorans]